MCVYVCVYVCVFALHTKWNVMLEVLLVSWRTMHSTSKCLLQVHRGLKDSQHLSSPANISSQICFMWGLHCVCLCCLFIAGNNNDEDFRLSWWLVKPKSVPPSPGSNSQKTETETAKKSPYTDILWGKQWKLFCVEVLWSTFVICWREENRWCVPKCWASRGQPDETW